MPLEAPEALKRLPGHEALLPWLETSPDAIILLNSDLSFLYANKPFYETLQLTEKPLTETSSIGALLPPDAGKRVSQLAEEVMQKGKPSKGNEISVTLKTGEVRWLSVSLSTLPFGESGEEVTAIMIIAKDITEQKVPTHQEMLAKALIEHSSDPIFITDFRGNIHYTTPRSLKALGILPDLAKESPLFKLLPEEAGTKVMAEVTEVLRSNKPSKCFDLAIQLPSGDERIFAVNILPIPDSKDQVVIVAKDTTKYHEAAMEFWDDVWHEIRSLLTKILAYPQVLLEQINQGDSEGQGLDLKKTLEIITDCAKRIKEIIENLALLSETFGMKVVKEPVPMGVIVENTLEELSLLIEEKNVEVIRPSKWPTVEGVSEWLRMVWRNYISNAIKYGGDPPKVELGATRNEDDTVTFWVKDNGPGLSSEEQARLFKRYTRLTKEDIEGKGLGLSIVHRVITRLGGKVGVESEPGKGSKFYFTLPAVEKAA